jgi:hypothetical protein
MDFEILTNGTTNTTDNLDDLFSLDLIPSSLVAFIAASLCSGVGIGGGAFYIATFILVNGMNVHLAVPLSKVSLKERMTGVKKRQRTRYMNYEFFSLSRSCLDFLFFFLLYSPLSSSILLLSLLYILSNSFLLLSFYFLYHLLLLTFPFLLLLLR